MSKLTIAEGKNIYEIANYLEEENFTTKNEFLKLCYDKEILQKYNIPAKSVEGYIFPSTYYIVKGNPPKVLLTLMIDSLFKKFPREDFENRAKKLGYSLHEVLTMALLKVKEQEKMLQEIGDLYAAEIQRLNEMGENDLEITELPLKAKTINKGVWKEGSEPGGDNAFADNTYVEKVNMAVLKKPMKAEEVKKAQDGLTGGKSWDEYRKEKITAAKEYFDKKIAEATQKYEERAVKAATKAKEKYIKDAKKAQKENGMSDEQIENDIPVGTRKNFLKNYLTRLKICKYCRLIIPLAQKTDYYYIRI